MHTYMLKELKQSQTQDQQQPKIMLKKKKIKNCAPFTHCKSEINNRQADNVKDIDMVRPMYDLIK